MIVKLLERVDSIVTWLLEVKHVLQQVEGLQQKITRALIDFVQIQDPRIDEILTKYGIIVSENGVQIFPRQKPYPQVIEIKKTPGSIN